VVRGDEHCSCTDGYTGSHCELAPCSRSNCSNHGDCSTTPGGNSCSCDSGYTGDRCQTSILPPCPNSYCNDHGTCRVTPGGNSCSCYPGYTGDQCQNTTAPGPTTPPASGPTTPPASGPTTPPFSCPTGCHEDFPGHCSCGGDTGGGSSDYRVVGRVYKADAQQNNYEIKSSDNKSATWTNDGASAYYYAVGKWTVGTNVTLSLTLKPEDTNKTCSWNFTNPDKTDGPIASGYGCTTSSLPIQTSSKGVDWSNHLTWMIVPLNSCNRCSTVYENMLTQWTAANCDQDPSAKTTVTRTYDASCHVSETILAKQCNRCSTINEGQYTWWILESGKTCSDDPTPNTIVYRASVSTCTLDTTSTTYFHNMWYINGQQAVDSAYNNTACANTYKADATYYKVYISEKDAGRWVEIPATDRSNVCWNNNTNPQIIFEHIGDINKVYDWKYELNVPTSKYSNCVWSYKNRWKTEEQDATKSIVDRSCDRNSAGRVEIVIPAVPLKDITKESNPVLAVKLTTAPVTPTAPTCETSSLTVKDAQNNNTTVWSAPSQVFKLAATVTAQAGLKSAEFTCHACANGECSQTNWIRIGDEQFFDGIMPIGSSEITYEGILPSACWQKLQKDGTTIAASAIDLKDKPSVGDNYNYNCHINLTNNQTTPSLSSITPATSGYLNENYSISITNLCASGAGELAIDNTSFKTKLCAYYADAVIKPTGCNTTDGKVNISLAVNPAWASSAIRFNFKPEIVSYFNKSNAVFPIQNLKFYLATPSTTTQISSNNLTYIFKGVLSFDQTNDGHLTQADLTDYVNKYWSYKTATSIPTNKDLNNDSKINILDYAMLKKVVVDFNK